MRAGCFRKMLAHQHTLLQHDFTQPPSNKKATKQNKMFTKNKSFLKITYQKKVTPARQAPT